MCDCTWRYAGFERQVECEGTRYEGKMKVLHRNFKLQVVQLESVSLKRKQ